nr:flagellar filament capping protein FliD [Nocardioides perillae]
MGGFDSASIVDQLMQLETIPQTRLKTRVTTETSQVSTLQSINAKLAALVTKAEAALDPAKFGGWAAASTSDKVTVKAGGTAAPTTISLTVVQTAASHQLGFAEAAAGTDLVTGADTQVRLDLLDGTTKILETGDGSLDGLVAALNDPDNATGVRATLVSTADGQRLLVESTATGEASDFALTALDGGALLGGPTVRAGRDALVELGAGITASSTTNTFSQLVAGIDVTIAPDTPGRAGTAPDDFPGTPATLTVARDVAAAGTLVKDLVDGLNAVLSEMRTVTAQGGGAGKAGVLAGDAIVRSVQSTLTGTLFGDGTTTLADFGIELDRSGTFTFDRAAFETAYAADPARAGTLVSGGFAERVRDVAKAASDKYDGTITTAITGRQAGIARLNDSIEAWDTRLELRRSMLTRQFTALETALSQMNSQSNWLAGQISSLPSAAG